MRTVFKVIGWRDPAYNANDAEGYSEYSAPKQYVVDLTKDDIENLDACGMVEYTGGNTICIDYEGIPFKEDRINEIVYDNCILFLPIEEDEEYEWSGEDIDEEE